MHRDQESHSARLMVGREALLVERNGLVDDVVAVFNRPRPSGDQVALEHALVERLAALVRLLPGATVSGDHAATFQLFLLHEIRLSEQCQQVPAEGRSRRDTAICEKKYRQRVRILGDTIAWISLGGDLIRSLGREPAPPVGLASQGVALDNVLRLALEMAGAETWTLLSDITNVVTVGDVVVLDRSRGDARLEIIECKAEGQNVVRPSARARRQNDRATAAAEYLQEGVVRLDAVPEGIDATPEEWGGQAADLTSREPQGLLGVDDGGYTEQNTAGIQDAVKRAQDDDGGVAEVSFGPGDHLLAVRHLGPQSFERLAAVMPRGTPNGGVVMHTERVRRPNALVAPVTAVPLSSEDAVDLLTGDLLLVRLVDLDRFNIERSVEGMDIRLRLRDLGGSWPFTVTVDGFDGRLGPSFLERCLFGFVPVSAVVEEMTDFVATSARMNQLSVEQLEAAAASSVDEATYRVVEIGSTS